ncbi:hypothetical protein DPMN_052890 [Dreissena polymorpha]|uniref:Uncharacterized protein n=1 Tax=Dreissena polymorpha TaxID=45954 RepID=A0A9D4CMA0_DREPO|nr:hypothetical protein DPMN_052890 [Dreissena polymorpha]
MASKRFSTISEEVLKALDRDKDKENPAELNNQLLGYAFSMHLFVRKTARN